MESNFLMAVPLLVGLFFAGVALFERAVKTYLEKKKEDPTLKFDSTYLLNLWVSTGASAAIVAIVSSLITLIPEQNPVVITFYSLISTAILGYTTAYTILDKLNTSTEVKFALAKAGITTTTTAQSTGTTTDTTTTPTNP